MTSPAICIAPDAPLKEAARLMAWHRVSALPVTDCSGAPVGLISERDLLSYETSPDPRLHLLGLPPDRLRSGSPHVAQAMHTPVITIDADVDIGLATERMLEARIKRLPVIAAGRVIGVLSRHDLVKLLANPDEMVRAGILRTLALENVPLDHLTVEVREGIASLSGDLSRSDLGLAEMLARTVPGVLGVAYALSGPGRPALRRSGPASPAKLPKRGSTSGRSRMSSAKA
jgi:CBS domain-containing protein